MTNLSIIITGPDPITGLYANSNGGTELLYRALMERLPSELKEGVQLICSRPDKLLDKPRILWNHDHHTDPPSDYENLTYRQKFANHVFVSHIQQLLFVQSLGMSYDETTVIRNAITPIEKHQKIYNQGEINLIYHTTPHRGLELLVPAFIEVSKANPQLKLHLDIYSSFNAYGWPNRDVPYQPLFDLAKSHPQITYHGYQSNDVVREALKKAHIFAYPNIWPETSCQIAGSKIMTDSGIKSIEDIKVGDRVLTHTGVYKRVYQLKTRYYTGKLVGIKSASTSEKSWFTPEHPILVGKIHKRDDAKSSTSYTKKMYGYEWISAGDLNINNHLTLRPKGISGGITNIKLMDHINHDGYIVVDGMVRHTINRDYKQVPNLLDLDYDFGYMLGVFAGDGSCTSANGKNYSTITFSHNIKERKNSEIILRVLGDGKLLEISDNELKTVVYNSIWARFLKQNIGTGKDKKIPSFVMESSKEFQMAFLDGYFNSDGCLKTSNGTPRKSITTVSPSLGYGLCQILNNIGYFSSINLDKYGYYTVEWRESPSKKFFFEDEKYFGTKITELTKVDFSGMVYNIEVEDDHSYVTGNIIAHNCLAALEAMSAGCLVICPMHEGLIETVGNRGVTYTYNDDHQKHINKFASILHQVVNDFENVAFDNITYDAQRHVNSYYSWDNRMPDWIDLYEKVIKNGQSSQENNYKVN